FAPDLLLLDVMMPGLSGLETLAKLRRQDELADVPVVFMTSKDVTSKHHSDITKCADGAIQKPFDPVALPDQLRAIVAGVR
ncbi:MAG: response regulator, partial [Pseudomonadota bacterium]|nr:response regulator [Pseudomonadota bacterium]